MKLFWIVLIAMMPSVVGAQSFGPLFPSGGGTPCVVDFEDFIAFAQAFNTQKGQHGYDPKADINDDGVVNFSDFIAFAKVFGLEAPTGPATKQFLDRRCYTVPYGFTGQVMRKDRPFENVWVDVLDAEKLETKASKKTDKDGLFDHSNLDNGQYLIVPHKFGYVFIPDTLRATVEDTLLMLSPIQAVFLFGGIDIQVVQDGKPLKGVDVLLWHSVAGQKAKGPWTGTTDPSGVTAIRIYGDHGQANLTGYYQVVVSQTETHQVLGSWMGVPIGEDAGRLVLEVGNGNYYYQEVKYPYIDDLSEKKASLTDTDHRLWVWFRNDVTEEEKTKLLDTLGLSGGDSYIISLVHREGKFAFLEAMHGLKKSGLVKSVVPYLRKSNLPIVLRSDRLKIYVKEDVPKTHIDQLFAQMNALPVAYHFLNNSYEVEIQDFPSLDVFEFYDQYDNHPIIRSISLDTYGYYFVATKLPDQ